jgi:hypothetical protein
MATFEKAFVMGYVSLDKFAEADGCLKIYESDSNYHVVRRPADEEAILNSPYVKNPRLVWSKGSPVMPQQLQAHQPSAPAPAVAAPVWAPTHLVPAAGMAFWAAPDGRQPPVGQLPANLELVLEASAGAWAQVRAINGWRGWVDGRLLAAKGLRPVGQDVAGPKGQTDIAREVLGEVGVLFDIDGLGGGYYRYSAFSVLFKRLDPMRLTGCTLLDGDTSETLARNANTYCVAFQSVDPAQAGYIREALRDCDDEGLLPTSSRFVEGAVTGRHPLVVAGRIDGAGRLVVREGEGIGEGWVKGTPWTVVIQ